MKRPFSLSPRLQVVAELVPSGARLADVGTDHGRLPIWLIQQGRIDRAVASDLRPGPLSRAVALAERWKVSDRISFRLCDGLSRIGPEEADTVTITGMGGETIAAILDAASWTGKGEHHYILQAMSGMDGLRRYLSEKGFLIRREVAVAEGNTLYVILLAKPGAAPPLSEGEIWVGRQDAWMGSGFRERYLEQESQRLLRAITGLERSLRPEDIEKRNYFIQVAQEVARMKKEWEQWPQS